jgi:hypothetical protein
MRKTHLAAVRSLGCAVFGVAACAAAPDPAPEANSTAAPAFDRDETAVLSPPAAAPETAAAVSCPVDNVGQFANQPGYVCGDWAFQGKCGAPYCSIFGCACHNNNCLATEQLQSVYWFRDCIATGKPAGREFLVGNDFVSCNLRTCPF